MATYFFEGHIKPAIVEMSYRHIVEIGVAAGANTVNLLQLAQEVDAFLYCIDPSTDFGPDTQYQRLLIVRKPSLQALKTIKQIDCAVIDGDHNWYTVYNELKLVGERLVTGGTVFLHDVLWPYGRRDMYYEPKRVPRKYRHPYQKMGIVQGKIWLSPDGINGEYYNAAYEGGSRNGVLTAIEDFLRLNQEYAFSIVQAEHGLGVLQKRPAGA